MTTFIVMVIFTIIIYGFFYMRSMESFRKKQSNTAKEKKYNKKINKIIQSESRLKEKIDEAVLEYSKLLKQDLDVVKNSYSNKEEELLNIKQKVEKQKFFLEDIKLQEKLYAIYNRLRITKEDKINFYEHKISNIKIEEIKKEIIVNFHFKKNYTFILKDDGYSPAPDGGEDTWQFLSLLNGNNTLIRFLIVVTPQREWYGQDEITMSFVDIFKNGDWVMDMSLLYESIKIKVEEDELHSKYNNNEIEKIKANFDIE